MKHESNQMVTLSFSQLIILPADVAYEDGTDRLFRNVAVYVSVVDSQEGLSVLCEWKEQLCIVDGGGT
jgi:hypothetical protein